MLAAAGGGAEADAGVTLVAAGGGLWGVGTDGGSGLGAPAEKPLVKPWDRSWAAVVGVGRPAGAVGAEGILGVLGIDGVLGMEGIGGGRIPLPDIPDMPEAGLIGGAIEAAPALSLLYGGRRRHQADHRQFARAYRLSVQAAPRAS